MDHIVNQLTLVSPYISMTRSFEVAESYARYYGTAPPTPASPAFVYEIIFDPMPPGIVLYDPVQYLAASLPSPLVTPPYQHNGGPDVLLALVDRVAFGHILTRPVKNPGGTTGAAPSITEQLNALVRALRDAEVLAQGAIPQTCVRQRFSIN